jgi:hypothetical protein
MRHNTVNVSTLSNLCTKLEEEKRVDAKFMSNADQNRENSSTFYKDIWGSEGMAPLILCTGWRSEVSFTLH